MQADELGLEFWAQPVARAGEGERFFQRGDRGVAMARALLDAGDLLENERALCGGCMTFDVGEVLDRVIGQVIFLVGVGELRRKARSVG